MGFLQVTIPNTFGWYKIRDVLSQIIPETMATSNPLPHFTVKLRLSLK